MKFLITNALLGSVACWLAVPGVYASPVPLEEKEISRWGQQPLLDEVERGGYTANGGVYNFDPNVHLDYMDHARNAGKALRRINS